MRRIPFLLCSPNLVCLVSALFLLVACGNRESATKNLVPADLQWASYQHPVVGYSVAHPQGFEVDEDDGRNLLFRFEGQVPVLVRFTSEEEGRDRGAWFGSEAVADVELGGRSGHKYIYDHYDGPFRARTIAYVISHQDRWLGLEFRSDGDLDPVQQKILESFKLSSS